MAIPLAALLPRLPEAVARYVKRSPHESDVLTLSVSGILEQLPRGEVKISYAQLRQGSPPGTFAEPGPDDQLAISLPLDLIVPLLRAEHLARRPAQRKQALTGEINPVFTVPASIPQERVEIRGLAAEGEVQTPAPLPVTAPGLPQTPGPRAPAPAMPAPLPRPAAIKSNLPGPTPAAAKPAAPNAPTAFPSPPSITRASQPAPPPPPSPATESPIRFASPPSQAAPTPRLAAAPSARGPAGLAPGAPAKPAPMPGTVARPAPLPGTASLPGTTARPAPPGPAQAPTTIPRLHLTPDAPAALEHATPAPATSAPPTPAPSAPVMPGPSSDRLAPPAAAAETGVVRAAIWALMVAWPEALRTELVHKGLTQRIVVFPGSALEPGIKTGRVSFAWEILQTWIEPALAPGEIPDTGPAPLPIPLQVIAPLFMALKKPVTQRKVQIADTIPELFTGKQTAIATPTPPAAAPAEPVAAVPEARASSTPPVARAPLPALPSAPFAAPIPGGVAPRPISPAAPAPDLAAWFGQPGKVQWTPVELVQHACRLPGVAGTLIALTDGLQVASQLPGGLDGDTLAAFLPQIFARVAHYTNEIKLGEPAVVSFTANQQVWQINKAGRVFFLAVGRAGEDLPSAALNAIASQLERQSRTN